MALAWWTRDLQGPWHAAAGYGLVVWALLRCGLAWRSTDRYSGGSRFLKPISITWRYARSVWQGQATRYLGHNPLGGWMVLILLCLMMALGVSGWLCTTEWFWGYAEPLEVHAAIAWICLGCIALHIAGVILSSLMHRENLVIAMITGRKRSAQGSDVD